jgi:hypothetical protein
MTKPRAPDTATRHDAPFPYVQRKSALELTRGLGWDSPTLTVIETMDRRLSSVEKFARHKESTRERRERLSHY